MCVRLTWLDIRSLGKRFVYMLEKGEGLREAKEPRTDSSNRTEGSAVHVRGHGDFKLPPYVCKRPNIDA